MNDVISRAIRQGYANVLGVSPLSAPEQTRQARQGVQVERERRATSPNDTEAHREVISSRMRIRQRFRNDPETYRSIRRIWSQYDRETGNKNTAWRKARAELRALLGQSGLDSLAGCFDCFPESPDQHVPKATATRVYGQQETEPDCQIVRVVSLESRFSSHPQFENDRVTATKDWNQSKFKCNEFIQKIQTRFPGRPQIEQNFQRLMRTKRPAVELRSPAYSLLRTAPELRQDYDRLMEDFDRCRQISTLTSHGQSSSTPQYFNRGKHEDHGVKTQLGSSQYKTPMSYMHRHSAFVTGDGQHAHNRDATREDVRRFLSLPDTEIDPQERMATPHAMSCRLMEHQRCGLTWMVRQEEDDAKQGGLLADDMGLGKTVQALALILSRQSDNPARKTTLIVSPLGVMKQWEREIQQKVKPTHRLSTYIYHGPSRRRVTLRRLLSYDVIITTYNTIVSEYKLKWGTSKAGRRTRRRHLKSSPKLVLLHPEAYFHRIILDEAHTIRKRQAQCSMAMAELQADYRLCLTGTPFMNSTAEIFPLIRFLQISPYNRWELFDSQIIRPLNRWFKYDLDEDDIFEEAMVKLQAIFRAITLRRTKSSTLDGLPILELPVIRRLNVPIKFNQEQADFYCNLEEYQQKRLANFRRSGADKRQLTIFIIVLLLQLRQACCHPHLIKDREIPFGCLIGKHRMIELALKLGSDIVDQIRAVEQFQCLVCADKTTCPIIIYPCGHYTCPSCFTGMMEVEKVIIANDSGEEDDYPVLEPRCPWPKCTVRVHGDKVICHSFFKQAFEGGRLLAPGTEDTENPSFDDKDDCSDLGDFVVSDDESDGDSMSDVEMADVGTRRPKRLTPKETREQCLRILRTEFVSSPKIDKAMQLLREIGPHKKTLIFSQWTSFLDLLEIPITDAGYRYTRYDGAMKPSERDEAVRKFQENTQVQIMLVSLKAGNAGLNLTAAQHVLLMEPDWNPFVEDQAVNRTHRIGQQNEVTVHRLLIAGTVEDRILQLQEKKRRLVHTALSEDGAQGISSLTRKELLGLFTSL